MNEKANDMAVMEPLKVEIKVDRRKLNKEINYLKSKFPVTLYTSDEVRKLCDAYVEKYNLSPCDQPPYNPKGIRVLLSGKIVK